MYLSCVKVTVYADNWREESIAGTPILFVYNQVYGLQVVNRVKKKLFVLPCEFMRLALLYTL